jgi:hypothetical protein
MQKLAEARVNSEIASQIESFKPVRMNMGFWNFLPIQVPFLEQVVGFSQKEERACVRERVYDNEERNA